MQKMSSEMDSGELYSHPWKRQTAGSTTKGWIIIKQRRGQDEGYLNNSRLYEEAAPGNQWLYWWLFLDNAKIGIVFCNFKVRLGNMIRKGKFPISEFAGGWRILYQSILDFDTYIITSSPILWSGSLHATAIKNTGSQSTNKCLTIFLPQPRSALSGKRLLCYKPGGLGLQLYKRGCMNLIHGYLCFLQ